MNEITLLDTGPLVATLYRRDQYHAWAIEQISKLSAPLLTCEAVLTEACFLAQRMLGTSQPVYDFVETGAVKVAFNLTDEFESVKDLALNYQNVPMSLADACLVRMSEIYGGSKVFTTDGDFKIYRKNRNQLIPIIIHPEI